MQNLSPACLETTDARIQKAQDIRAQWEDELSSMSVSTEDRMAPRHALRELEKAMPKVSKKSTFNEFIRCFHQLVYQIFSMNCYWSKTVFDRDFTSWS